MNLDLNEFTCLDDVLADLKITPDKIDIVIPSYMTKVSAAFCTNILPDSLSVAATTFAAYLKNQWLPENKPYPIRHKQ